MSSQVVSNTSLWSEEMPRFPELRGQVEGDVCVVGAGMAGLCTAYGLARSGKRVIILEQDTIAAGESMATTAHLTSVLDTRFFELERIHGEEGVRRAAASHQSAIHQIEAVASAEQIACDFERVDGYLTLAADDSPDVLDWEFEAARRAGLSVEMVQRGPFRLLAGKPCLKFAQQAQFHPGKFLRGLLNALQKYDVEIFCHSHVTEVEEGKQSHVGSAHGTVHAPALVVATNTPINNIVTMHTKQAAYRSYVLGFEVPPGSLPRALLWDTADPYHYVRVHPGGDRGQQDYLIVGGEDHKTGQADDYDQRYERLETWARARFPEARAVKFRWSGQIIEPVDGLAYIGRNPGEHDTFIATGTSGNGMTYGMIAGLLLTDLILGRSNSWETVYDPARTSFRAVGEYLRENLNVASWYRQLLTPGEVKSADEVAPGSGAVMRRGLTKVAIYRDEQGKVCERSAICPHLQCVVNWNSDTHTWDCPCHGSRFDPHGRVISGPAVSDLPPADK